MKKVNTKIVVILLLALIIVSGLYFYKSHSKKSLPKCDCTIVFKINQKDYKSGDLYIKNGENETFFKHVNDSYPNAQYRNGNVYFTEMTKEYKPNADWTRELWKYDENGNGKKIYAGRISDYRVKNDEQVIVISVDQNIKILDSKFKEIKSYTYADFGIDVNNNVNEESPMISKFGKNTIWFDFFGVEYFGGVAKIDLNDFKINVFKKSGITVYGEDFDVNTETEMLAGSEYPYIDDADTRKEYETSGAKLDLVIYDLKNDTKKVIATSAAKKFLPKWINDNTIEYNDPNSEGRIQKVVE